MNNEKKWYEKVGTIIAILAGTCTIFNFINNYKPYNKQSSENLTVTSSCHMKEIQSSIQGIDVLITAETTFDADYVTITSLSKIDGEKTFQMHGSEKHWEFTANFYVKDKYEITITAYNSNGEKAIDKFTYKY